MDPAHVRAIENYLRIVTRAFGLPQSHRQQAQDDTPSSLGTLYKKHPHIEPHFQGILQGDHVALSQYLDLLQELGDMRLPQQEYASHHLGNPNFLDHLVRMHSNSDDLQSGIHTMYSQAALEHPDTQNEVRRVIHYGNLIDRLRDLPAYHVPHGQQGLYRGTGLRNQAMAGDIHGLLGLHDLAADPSNDPAEAAGVHRQLEAGLRNRLIPHLAENFG